MPAMRSSFPDPALAESLRLALLALTAVSLIGPWPGAVQAEASLALCRQWQASRGDERIRLGNAIGVAAYLTKVRRLGESPSDSPQLLYAPSDLRRSCQGWR